jgi:hypothetical protein
MCCHDIGEVERREAVPTVYVPDRAHIVFTVKESAMNTMTKEQNQG